MELLVVIGLIAIIITIAVPIYLKTQRNILEKQYENVVARIEVAAVKYAKATSLTRVNVKELIDKGYLIADDQDTIYDPRDNTSLNCRIIEIAKEKGEYAATLTDNGTLIGGTCSEYKPTQEDEFIKAECYSEVGDLDALNKCNEAIKNTNGKWYTGSVKLSPNIKNDKKVTSYKWTSLVGDLGTEETFIVTTQKAKTTTFTLLVTYTDNTTSKGTIEINIDNENPIITNTHVDSKWTNYDKEVKVLASDGNYSGIDNYYIGQDSTCPIKEFDVNNTKKLGNGTYYACAKDKVGNKSLAKIFTVSGVDKEKPTCEIAKFNGKTVIQANCSDADSGIESVKYYISNKKLSIEELNSIENWKNFDELDFNPSCGNYYYLYTRAVDKAGNIFISEASDPYHRSCSSSSGSSGGGSSSSSTSSSSNSGNTCDRDCQMQRNSEEWWDAYNSGDTDRMSELEEANKNLSNGDYTYDDKTGEWHDGDRLVNPVSPSKKK